MRTVSLTAITGTSIRKTVADENSPRIDRKCQSDDSAESLTGMSKRPSLHSLITLLKRCVSLSQMLFERKVSAWPTEASLRDGPHNIEGVPDIVGTSIRKQYNFQLVTTESRLFCEQNFLTRTQEGKPLFLSSPQRLREPLRLPPHSFTYY